MDAVGKKNKSHAEYKRLQRERKRAEGYVLKQIWVKPDKWAAIKELIRGKNSGGC